MLGTLFLLLAIFVVVGAFLLRSRHRRAVRGDAPLVADDPLLRAILSDAEPEDAEPLDEREIREAEDRFWEEEWDEPEEWGG